MVTFPTLESVYVVEQVPLEMTQTDLLKLPVLLLVLQVTAPVGLDPDTFAVQVTKEPAEERFGEQTTEVEVIGRA